MTRSRGQRPRDRSANMNSSPAADTRPRSVGSFALNVVGLLVGLLAGAISERLAPHDSGRALLSGVGAVALTIIAGDIFFLHVNRRESTGLAASPLRRFSLLDMGLHLLGLLVTLAAIGLAYWLFPEYHGPFYDPYWQFLRTLAYPVLCLAPVYFLWVGRRLEPGKDPYLLLGRLAIGRGWRAIDVKLLRAHGLAWTVKGFFLPLMVVYLWREIPTVAATFGGLSWDTMRWYSFGYELSYLIDLMFCVVGYTFTLRALDSHIRSTEPTALGWAVALVCYQPFYSVIGRQYLSYDESSLFWDVWLAPHPAVRTAWALAILTLTTIYALSTVAFGLRFSNLTNRGIVTSGPYRFTKHPAYIAKNLSWWLISVPFISRAGWLEALRHCALLGGLNFIYFVRARTEERHLSQTPEYVAYAQWIREHGLFSRLRRLTGSRRTLPNGAESRVA